MKFYFSKVSLIFEYSVFTILVCVLRLSYNEESDYLQF